MSDKLLISISARQVSAARWRKDRFSGCDIFTYSEEGLAAFREYLAPLRGMVAHVMVDAVEEDYRYELLPHSAGSARGEMVNRKLRQNYRNTPYTNARIVGRDTGKRRDDRYLLCALTNPELIAGWVQAVIERGLPLAGIYLLPTVGHHGLLERLQLKQVNLLVVSSNSSGLRLTFFRGGELRVSRLARIDSTAATAVKSYAEEISNTRLYLHGLRITTLDEPLSLLLVDHDDTLTELAGAIARDNPFIECHRLGREEIVARLGISAPALDSSADALYLHLLGLHAPDSNLAPPDATSGYRQHQARRGIYALTGAATLVIALWSSYNWYRIFDIRLDTQSDTTSAARQTEQLRAEYQQATQQFPATPTSADNLRRAVEISQKIGATLRSPGDMMNVVSQALDRNPAIVLKMIGWKYGVTNIESGSSKAAAPRFPATAAGTRRQSGLVEGEVQPFRGDYRSAIETITRFADTIAQQPGVAEVKVVKLPLDINPGQTLAGNTTEASEQAGKAEFKLLLVLKATP